MLEEVTSPRFKMQLKCLNFDLTGTIQTEYTLSVCMYVYIYSDGLCPLSVSECVEDSL